MIEAAFLADSGSPPAPRAERERAQRPLVLSISHSLAGAPLDRWRCETPHSEWRRLSVECEGPPPAEQIPVRYAAEG